MALDRDSYLQDFFDEDQLEWYRELHERYPMWSGAWPTEARDLREYEPWETQRRLDEHAQIGEAYPLVVWQPQGSAPTESFIPKPLRVLFKAPQELGYARAPNAVLSAIWYACHPWHLPEQERGRNETAYGPEQMLLRWSRLIDAELALPPPEVLATIDRHFGVELAQQRDAVLRARGRERKPLIEELKKTWAQLGEAIGVIPTTAHGTILQLRGRLLDRLLSQGAQLVEEATNYRPASNELRAIRAAIQGEKGLKPLTIEMLAALRKRGDDAEAERILLKKQSEALSDDEVLHYAKWLRYPVLNRDEVDDLLTRSERDSEQSHSLALDFILLRWQSVGLSFDRSTVQKALK